MKPICIATLFFLAACSGFKQVPIGSLSADLNEETLRQSEHVYLSGANDVAEILLVLKTDNTFALSMMILPQPMTEDEVEYIQTSGRWSQQGSWIRLTFKNKRLDLNALFDMNYADDNQFKVIDERNVEINDEPGELVIWGITCERIK